MFYMTTQHQFLFFSFIGGIPKSALAVLRRNPRIYRLLLDSDAGVDEKCRTKMGS